MKYSVSIILLSLLFVGCMSMTPREGQETIVKVYENLGANKSQLYKKALAWMATTYNSANSVIQLKDPEAGKIIGKGAGTIQDMMFQRWFKYTITIDIKDNRMRVKFSNLRGYRVGEIAGPTLSYSTHYDKAKANLLAISSSLYSYVSGGAKKDDNW